MAAIGRRVIFPGGRPSADTVEDPVEIYEAARMDVVETAMGPFATMTRRKIPWLFSRIQVGLTHLGFVVVSGRNRALGREA